MLRGAPFESRWLRPTPRRTLPESLLNRIVQAAFPHSQVVDVRPFTAGLRNANFRIQLDSPGQCVVLRIYEHHPSLCRKEMDLLNLVSPTVPVPEVIHEEPDGWNDMPPFVLFRYVDGITFHELKRGGDAGAISQAAFSVGRTLALIHRIAFPKPGWLGPGPRVGSPLLEGPDPAPRFVASCLESENLERRMHADLRDSTAAMVWSYAPQLAGLDNEKQLAHGDFGKSNLVVQRAAGAWTVAAVLDWEFAIAGSPLTDVGHFLRYERNSRPLLEPHFSDGYLEAGGLLQPAWRRLARIVDLIALCEALTHEELPGPVISELVELVRATVEDRDPLFD